MKIYFKVDFIIYEIGSDAFLNAFFSTVAYHLEDKQRGTRFPVFFNKLYRGKVEYQDISDLSEELKTIKKELKKYMPNEIIWDIDNLAATPPWGNNISPDITDLSNYFVTSDGRDLFDVMFQALKDADSEKLDLTIEAIKKFPMGML